MKHATFVISPMVGTETSAKADTVVISIVSGA